MTEILLTGTLSLKSTKTLARLIMCSTHHLSQKVNQTLIKILPWVNEFHARGHILVRFLQLVCTQQNFNVKEILCNSLRIDTLPHLKFNDNPGKSQVA